jgi:hypothetical protein
MTIEVQAWTFPTEGDEEPCVEEMVESEEFTDEDEARRCAWQRLEEGYFVRIWRR